MESIDDMDTMDTWNSNYSGEMSTSPDYDHAEAEGISRIVAPIVFGLFGIIGLFGNCLVVMIVVFNRQMHIPANLLFANLAFSNILLTVFCLPFFVMHYAFQLWIFGNAWCKIVHYLVIVFRCINVYTLMHMSIERFLVLMHPAGSRAICTNRNTYLVIIITWLVIIIACTPLLEIFFEYSFKIDELSQAYCIFRSEEYSYFSYVIIVFLSTYAIPLILICGLYCLMFSRVSQGVLVRHADPDTSKQEEKSITRLVVITVVVFTLCGGPTQVMVLLANFSVMPWSIFDNYVYIALELLSYVNPFVNFILYVFLSDNFRNASKKLMSCGQTRS